MTNKRVFPPCPHCGSQRRADGEPTSHPLMNAWANDGEIPVYYLKCDDCEQTWCAFIGALPPHASLSGLDEHLRMNLRNRKRAKFGYDGQTTFVTRGAKRIDSDRIEASIRIRPGRISPGLAKKLKTTASTRHAQYRKVSEEIA